MSRRSIVTLVAALVAAALTSAASAAVPTKGAQYEGALFVDSTAAVTKTVRLTVAPTGKTARVTWSCGTQRAHNTLQFAIAADGSFKAYSNTGSLTVWSFVGRFVSPTVARTVLHLNATCDGKGGLLSMKLKA
jgi:hypothetical protein